MKLWKIITLCAVFSFMFLFITVGYAQLTDILTLHGTMEWTEPPIVYITDIKLDGTSNTSGNETPAITKTGTLTFKHNDYILNKQVGSKNPGGSFTITVTVKNNSGVPQYFGGHTSTSQSDSSVKNDILKYLVFEYINGKNPQTNIDYGTLTNGRWVAHGATMTFTFKIQNTKQDQTFPQKVSGDIPMDGFVSMLLFSPEFNAEEATKNTTAALAKTFSNILAGNGPNGDPNETFYFNGTQYTGKDITTKLLIDRANNNAGVLEPVTTGGYMGNIPSAPTEQQELAKIMFGDQIIIPIGDNYYSVYILIKNQEVSGDGKKDMVIYITADQLNTGGGRWQGNNLLDTNDVPVYALVFVKDGDTYKYCDHLFEGKAPVCDFSGAFGDGKVGNFNTNVWKSTEFTDKEAQDQSSGSFGSGGISKDGALDDTYRFYIKKNGNGVLIPLDELSSRTDTQSASNEQ